MFDSPLFEIESLTRCQEEMSAAALHTVVAAIGGSIAPTSHVLDASGVDAVCCFDGYFTDLKGEQTGKTLLVQLKSTRRARSVQKDGEECWALSVGVRELKKYKAKGGAFILALLVLPSLDEFERWVAVDENAVLLRRSIYWTSLENVEIDASKKTNVVYIPKRSRLTPSALVALITDLTYKGIFQ